MRNPRVITAAALAALALAACSRESGKSMDAMKKGATASVEAAQSIGVVKAVDAEARTVTLSHDAIPEMAWGAMTMTFGADPAIDISSIKAGDNLHFMLKLDGAGSYRVAMACRIEGDMEAHRAAMKSMMEDMMDGDMMMDMDMQGGVVMPCTLDPRYSD